ncbi:MAG: hypothetical protein ABEJ07_01210 [Candidatus Nanohaloarchaea archaeon]
MRKLLCLVLVVLLITSAYSFSASLQAVDRKASTEDPGVFHLEVENTAPEAMMFQLSAAPYSSWFYTESTLTVPAGENHTFELIVTPPENAVQQNYRFDATVTAGGETRSFTDYFTVEQPEDLVIRTFSSRSQGYTPGETAEFRVGILNTAPSRVEDYSVRAIMGESSTEKQGLPLSPGSSGVLALNLPVPDDAAPGEKRVTLSVIRGGEARQTVNQTITVEQVRRVERSVEKDNRLLFYTRTASVKNTGNAPTTVELNQTLPDYLRPITSFEPAPDSRTDKGDSTTYSWNFELGPGETESASRTTDYWIPGSILIALLAGLLALKHIRTELSFRKTARKTEEGIKVHIELENHSGQPVREVTVEDFVPDIATVSEEFPMAKPVIRKTSNGTRLTWEIDELEPGSQRVFEYTISPMFEVEGGVTLPPAELESGGQKAAETGETEAEFRPGDT